MGRILFGAPALPGSGVAQLLENLDTIGRGVDAGKAGLLLYLVVGDASAERADLLGERADLLGERADLEGEGIFVWAMGRACTRTFSSLACCSERSALGDPLGGTTG
jgi:hypothetical protein